VEVSRPMEARARPSSAPVALDREDRILRAAAVFFVLAVLFHNSDHARRGGTSVTTDVFWIGGLALVLEVGIVALIFMRHRDAPLAAVAAGFVLALGYIFVHFTPHRAWLSDTFIVGRPALMSRIAASLEVAAALVLGFAGLFVFRRRRAEPREGGAISLTETLLHPAVASMALGNLVIFILVVSSRYG